MLLLCGDIEVTPGPIYETSQAFSSTRGIKILHQNIRGLFGKRDILSTIFDSGNIDIFTLSETHIREGSHLDVHDLYSVPGYHFVKKNRRNGPGGGTAMYISDKFTFVRRHDLEQNDLECIWMEFVFQKAKNILVGCMYRPPDSSLYTVKKFDEKFESMLAAQLMTLI